MHPSEPVDLLIVGSGPSGISTALHLLRRDRAWAGRLVVVDKEVHPREKLCGGGITHLGQNVLAELGLPVGTTHFEVKEVRLVYEDRSYSLYGNPVFRIVRRAEFDHWLVGEAEKRGIKVCQGEAVKDVIPHEEHVEVVTSKRTFLAKVVVAADGSRSFVRSRLKWEDASRVARLLEVLTPEDPRTEVAFRDGVALFDFSALASGLQGYYWDFPSYVQGQPMMNRGVFDSRTRPERPRPDLKQTLRGFLQGRGKKLEDYPLKGHPIRWFDPGGRFAMPRVLLVGDAAGVDPLFGEGISFALGYGVPAAAAIADAFARHDFSFAGYRQRVLADPLLSQLVWRRRIARFAYLLPYPWLFRVGWRLARLAVRFTRWRDPQFVPARPPRLLLEH